MFWLSKIFWLFFLPSNLLLWLLLAGCLLALLRRPRAASWCLVPVALVATAVTVLPVGTWLLIPLEARFPSPSAAEQGKPDGVIVLGGSLNMRYADERDRPALNDAAERITAMIALARRHPAARIVFAGGSGDMFEQTHREADGLRRLLGEMGVETSRILFERDSRNTVENARYTRRLVKPEPEQRWLLVTSAAHMPRAVGVFRRQGWAVIAYPVDYHTPRSWTWRGPYSLSGGLRHLDAAAREWVGLLAYRILGYTKRLFPGPAPDG